MISHILTKMTPFLILFTALILHVGATDDQFSGGNFMEGVDAAQQYDIGRAGYVTIDGIEYYIDDVIKRDWSRAKDFCNNIRKDLVAIESERENSAIRGYLQENGIDANNYWTSGSLVVGRWMWTNKGLEFQYDDWAPGQPDSESSEACMYVTQDGWADDDCTVFSHYICQ